MDRKRRFQAVLCFIGIAVFLTEPSAAQEGVRKALQLCGGLLIPSLFPVSVLSGCLIRLQAVRTKSVVGKRVLSRFGLSESGLLAAALGLLGGYPLGAQIVSSMYREGKISKSEAEALSCVCNNAGPAFLIGAVGAVLFSDPLQGFRLWIIQIVSAFLTGLLLLPSGRKPDDRSTRSVRSSVQVSAQLPAAIAESSLAMLRLTGSVAFFCAVQSYLDRVLEALRLPILWNAGLSCFLELAGGISRLSELSSTLRFPLAAAFCGFGGICVHLQAWACFNGAGIPAKRYLLAKSLQGLIAGSLAILLQGTTSCPHCLLAAGIAVLFLSFSTFFKKQIGIRQNL